MTGNAEYVLAALRCTSLRVQLIRMEIDTIGVALKGGVITPEAAVEWCDEVAPGCLELVAGSVVMPEEVAA